MATKTETCACGQCSHDPPSSRDEGAWLELLCAASSVLGHAEAREIANLPHFRRLDAAISAVLRCKLPPETVRSTGSKRMSLAPARGGGRPNFPIDEMKVDHDA